MERCYAIGCVRLLNLFYLSGLQDNPCLFPRSFKLVQDLLKVDEQPLRFLVHMGHSRPALPRFPAMVVPLASPPEPFKGSNLAVPLIEREVEDISAIGKAAAGKTSMQVEAIT